MQCFSQEYIPVGCIPSAAVAVRWGGVSAWEGSAQGGLLGGVWQRVSCLPRGECLPSLPGGGVCQTPPPLWTEFLTHACENISAISFVDGKNI